MFDIDYSAVKDNMITYLNSQNTITATYDLSLGLEKRIKNVVDFDETLEPTMQGEYPKVFIRIKNKIEELECYNNNRMARMTTLNFQAFCVYDSIKRAKKNEYDMIRNISTVIRNNPSFDVYPELSEKIVKLDSDIANVVVGNPSIVNKSGVVNFSVTFYTDRTTVAYYDNELGAGNYDTTFYGDNT